LPFSRKKILVLSPENSVAKPQNSGGGGKVFFKPLKMVRHPLKAVVIEGIIATAMRFMVTHQQKFF